MDLSKHQLSETEIRTQYITPFLQKAGWDFKKNVREELYLTDGRILVRGHQATRGKRKRADYVLFYKPHIPLAVIEAKDNQHAIGDGIQQALEYAEMLDVPFAFSSNGDGFLEHDRTGKGKSVERQLALDEFPSPDELWQRFTAAKELDQPQVKAAYTQDFHDDGSGKAPRYYQFAAVNRVIEAISKGQNRILLVMATGTGKTYTAFQIIWRLWKARLKKRILFLVDRNALADQTKIQDFKPFGEAMTKVTNRKIDKSYEIYLALYQAVTGTEDWENIYKQFSRDFFDLIVVDECHRGSADEASRWHKILDYFNSATHIGMTATPKETKDVSNLAYFGDPIYTYSLKQGIEDGFLAPYKVVRIDLDKDLEGWRPTEGQLDIFGNPIEDRIYNQKDFDKNLVLEERTKRVAEQVTQYLKETDRDSKTIIFCEDTEHAGRMRMVLTNLNHDITATDRRYVMRITGNDPEGSAEVDNFIDKESLRPTIACTSKLLGTGVDTKTVRLIVLDKNINSLTEFKQIIGRGTRVVEDMGKMFFTILDFKKATELFADPDFDGEPVQIYFPPPSGTPVPPETDPGGTKTDPEPPVMPPEGPIIYVDPHGEPHKKYYVRDVPVEVIGKRIQYLDEHGKLITESLHDHTQKTVTGKYASLDEFLQIWDSTAQKGAIILELEKQGVLLDALAEDVGRDYDAFDLICHVAFGQPPLTRKERATNVKKRNYFTKYGKKARVVLEALLEKYADEGLLNIETLEVLRVQPITYLGSVSELVQAFGGREQYLEAIYDLEKSIYLRVE